MDFTKLLALLETNRLYFPRADQFEDPYEGQLTKASVAFLRDPTLNGGLPPEAVQQFIDGAENMRRQMFISCWYMSEHESAAMWKLYLQSVEGVAVRTSHDALTDAISASSLSGRTSVVNYVDYERTLIPLRNLFFPFLHKRLSFAHETELRAIIWAGEDVNAPQIPGSPTSVEIDIDPKHLIKAIHVSPTAPKWFGALVEKVLTRYGIRCEVVRSSLYERPAY